MNNLFLKNQISFFASMNASITHPLNLIIIIIGSFLSLGLGIFLLFNKKNTANPILGILTLVISTFSLTSFFDRFDLFVHLPHFIGIPAVTSFLFGPLSYFYVSACTQKDFHMPRLFWLHFIPSVLDVILAIPFFSKTGAEKIDISLHFMKTGDLQQPRLLLILKALHCLAYMVLAMRLILRYIKHLPPEKATIDRTYHRWMLVFLFLMTLPVIGQIGIVILPYQRVLISVGIMSFFIFLMVIFIMALYKPEIFHTFPYQVMAEQDEDLKEKYGSSNLDPQQKECYLKKLMTYMETEKPYRDPELTIIELSNQINIPVNHVSQIINEQLNVHFLDFINGYRVNEVKEKLADPTLNHFTILAIAFETGFNSKSTFYAIFKKYTEMTPNEYRKQRASTGSVNK